MTDPAAYAELVSQLRNGVHGGGPRALVDASWQRSLAARIDPDLTEPPVVYDRGEVVDMRAEHPLAAVMPALRAMLVTVADEAEHVMIVTDADGHLLWREGSAKVCVRADKVNLTEGTRWTEDAIGTNAMGTAIAVNG
ncbi:transcriptional regulator, partial [Kibdelosporangium lantanae]